MNKRIEPGRKTSIAYIRQVMVCLLLGLLADGTGLQAQDYDARARQIVSQMTLPEKIEELHGIHDATYFRYVPGIPRLNIPPLHVANGPAGVGPAGAHKGAQVAATAMSAPISMASTWDVGTAERYGALIGSEAKDLDEDLLEAPDINIARVPQSGRTFEAFGEDPYLVARMGVNVIQGIQSQGVIANVKHFAANNQEADRHNINEIISARALREIYLPAFEAAVKEGRVASLMGAYNKVNGAFCCENDILLDQILKRDWGFNGFVTSDFDAVHSTVPSALAGLDLEMPTGKYFGDALEAAVKSGNVPMSVIDDKLIRRFRTMMQFGLFDQPAKSQTIPVHVDGLVARQLAEEGMVLLKNTGDQLPLDPTVLKNVAIIGPYAARAVTGGGGSSHVVPLYTITPVAGIQQRVGPAVNVAFADGSNILQAVELAKSADVAVVMVGDTETEGHDHPLTLGGNQDQLVEAVAAANPHTVVVLKTGSAVLMPWVDKVPAILEAWYPGEEDGNAVAAILFGDVNPSGKLPLTFPGCLADLPANTPEQYPGVEGVAHYSEGNFVGYRYFDAQNIQPLFPFGHGLSYTTFAYTDLVINSQTFSTNHSSAQTATIDLDVANTGNRFGQEVVELYVGFPSTTAIPQPPMQLKGFEKVAVSPGQTSHVRLKLDIRSLAYWDINAGGWSIMPGTYHILAGSSSRDIRLKGEFRVFR
jgi:beta-glucosidase